MEGGESSAGGGGVALGGGGGSLNTIGITAQSVAQHENKGKQKLERKEGSAGSV